MKQFLFTIIFLSTFFKLNAQNFSADVSFGNNGVVINTAISKNPIEIFFQDDKYFFVLSENIVCSYNYNGTSNIGFGLNGVLTFNNTSENYKIKGAKLHNGSIYVYGQLIINSNSNKNGFIVKLSTTGVLDSTFGSNGKVVFDFGHNEESINDIVFTPSSEIYAIGTRNYSIFLSKMNVVGNLDIMFDSNGYKTYPLSANDYSNGINIFSQNNELLLTGSSVIGAKYLALLKVNLNGDLIQSFGINGVKKIEVVSSTDSSTFGLIKTLIKNGVLYFSYTKAYSFSTIYNWLGKFNLNDESLEIAYSSLPFSLPYYFVDENNKLYYTGSVRCSPTTATNCKRDFFITKKNFDGTNDLSFSSTGTYVYDFFPNDFVSDDQSSVFYLHDDGKILIAGYSFNPMTTNGSGLSILRLGETNLNSSGFNFEKSISIYPNPTTNKIYIENNSQKTIKKILIFDTSGKILLEKDSFDQNIDISGFQNGIYFIQLKMDDAHFFKKIMKI
ncbi:T9SS type A sorting domain-containing protein [Flavobacterium sp. LMO8]|uniref:T9SS type A sorting domain-containing protein n=1 Tax=Flavobacterium sp. LMO8 TaxID=2654244 RepID=UPI001290DF9B|nr:T9SS type A sorting domain-containing protein [Flavobacterium sp. LMO8]MQP24994.1 T9SS type A sorting domain-containing protein [Flavobacterium sp. LMO8]